MIYVTWIISSNVPGDVSSRPLLPFLPPKFLAGRHTIVAIHSIPSPSLYLPLGSNHVSKLKQKSNGHSTCKEGVLPRLTCPRQLEPSNYTREPSTRVLQVPLLFSKHPLIYMHVCICFTVECESVCSQPFVLD
jgi:hypothetical protein